MRSMTPFQACCLCAALVLWAGACTGTSEGRDGGDSGPPTQCSGSDAGRLDCAAFCGAYCNKLDTCGVSTGAGCQDDCQTLTEAGAAQMGYACVIQSSCQEISNCGI